MMLRAPWEYGEIFMVQESDLSLSRMKNTVLGALMQHRKTLVITDADPALFDSKPADGRPIEDPVFCILPKAPEPWMSVIMDFVPGSLLAGYHAALNEIFFFAGRYDFRKCEWIGR